jgi:hypothetical protein
VHERTGATPFPPTVRAPAPDGVRSTPGPLAAPTVLASEPPLLSVVLVAGRHRGRAQRVLDAIRQQTRLDALEVVVVDLAAHVAPRLDTSGLRTVYLPRPNGESIGRARVEGVRSANAPIVAFIQDHSSPSTGWAEALLDAHRGPAAAVGYAVNLANPETYLARTCAAQRYGRLLDSAGRAGTDVLPPHNVSYKRDALLSFGDRLELLLTPDFNLHQALRTRGLEVRVEPRAVVAYEDSGELLSRLSTHFAFMRLLAARRAHSQSWGPLRRIVSGLGAPFAVPAVTTARFLSDLRSCPSLRRSMLESLPLVVLFRLLSGVAESAGYLRGAGTSEKHVTRAETDGPLDAPTSHRPMDNPGQARAVEPVAEPTIGRSSRAAARIRHRCLPGPRRTARGRSAAASPSGARRSETARPSSSSVR